MLNFEDPRWPGLEGGYRKPIDLRPFVRALEEGGGSRSAWDALWQELLHQGDVGVGSYAVVPHLVRLHRERGVPDWNTYALVASIEVARGRRKNPPLPLWAEEDYHSAIRDLASAGLAELPSASDPETVRAILAVLALAFGAGVHGRFLIEFSEDEAAEVIAETLGE